MKKAATEKIDLSLPRNAFVVAKFTPQWSTKGPLLWGFHDLTDAQLFAERQSGDVYLMSANPQHGLQSIRGGEPIFIDDGNSVLSILDHEQG